MKKQMKVLGLLSMFLIGATVAGCNAGDVPKPKREVYWTNPISLPDEWEQYGLGDPYVFSYNGTYYLYVSTRDTDAGVKVWSSPDLAEWTYQGMCADDPLTTGAYAPEVKYWNGVFYMYTSPAGGGHYVLTSESPTGPFKIATGNVGKSIDGSVFVDDDGQWYFYHAGTEGIEVAKMPDPLTFSASLPTGAYMGGWTEGPAVWKRNGMYYMTYTGNHVFSNGYRVDAAASKFPDSGFKGLDNNPVLLRAEGPTVGLGHNSVVNGPDLDSQFMVYHNLEGPGIVGPLRHMNIDRIVWNGERLSVLGPTSDRQPAPELPDFFDRFERDEVGQAWKKPVSGRWAADNGEGLVLTQPEGGFGLVVTRANTGDEYTAEFHVRLASEGAKSEGARVGAVFSYVNERNYGIAMLNASTNALEAQFVVDGQESDTLTATLPEGYDLTKLHQLRVEKSGDLFIIYVDGMKKLESKAALRGGSVGYTAEGTKANFGYVAFSNEVDGSSARHAYKPIPGEIQAIHFAESESGKNKADTVLKPDGEHGKAISGLKAGQRFMYRVNVAKAGSYDVAFRVRTIGDDSASLRLSAENKDLTGDVAVPASGEQDSWHTVVKRGVPMEAGLQTWTLEAASGEIDLVSIAVLPYEEVTEAEDDFEDNNDFGWSRYEGVWSVGKGTLGASSEQPAKTVFGLHSWGDYTVEADILRRDGTGHAGILVRVSEPADGMKLNMNRDDFVRGYYVYLDGERVYLDKYNYAVQKLANASYPSTQGKWDRLKVKVTGSVIEVFAGEGDQALITYEDKSANPFTNGGIGLKAANESVRFDRIKVLPATKDGE